MDIGRFPGWSDVWHVLWPLKKCQLLACLCRLLPCPLVFSGPRGSSCGQSRPDYWEFDSIVALIEPLQRAMALSGPKAWIWSRFSSACSSVVVRQIALPCESTALAILNPCSRG